MQYRLISAAASDEAWLESLRRCVYQELFHATWGGWDEDRHLRHFTACLERGHISVIEVHGARVGMVQIFNEPTAVEVAEIQVHPSHQNRGLGTCVLRDVIATAGDRRKAVRLRLGLENDKALRLYQRLGFRLVAQSETHNHMELEPSAGLALLGSPAIRNEDLNALFESAWPSHETRDFQPILSRSLVYIGAYQGSRLVGFVNVAWDGGVHGFILDTTVHQQFQRRGLGLRLLREAERQARASGLEWLHVDFPPDLELFYRAAGFIGMAAGLLRLR